MAVDCIADTSEPSPCSVKPKAANFSPFACGTRYFCFCSSVPHCKSDILFKPICTETAVRNVVSPRSNSSQTIAQELQSMPLPPYFSGIQTPIRSEEHTSELQSRFDLVYRLLLA